MTTIGVTAALDERSELAGDSNPQPTVLQDRGGSSMACWRVLSMQVASGGSSSQCAPVRPSSARWNDNGNDMSSLRPPLALIGACPSRCLGVVADVR